MTAKTRIYTQTAHIIATAITDAEDIRTKAAIAEIARQLADMFKADSRDFRYDRFFPACRLDNWGELLLPGNPVHPELNNPVSNGTNRVSDD